MGIGYIDGVVRAVWVALETGLSASAVLSQPLRSLTCVLVTAWGLPVSAVWEVSACCVANPLSKAAFVARLIVGVVAVTMVTESASVTVKATGSWEPCLLAY